MKITLFSKIRIFASRKVKCRNRWSNSLCRSLHWVAMWKWPFVVILVRSDISDLSRRIIYKDYKDINLFSHLAGVMGGENTVWRSLIWTLKWSQILPANIKLLLAKKCLNWMFRLKKNIFKTKIIEILQTKEDAIWVGLIWILLSLITTSTIQFSAGVP